jgi:DNA polymerase elongation subunit (family B)
MNATNKRPIGAAYKEWCKDWDNADHSGKLTICKFYGVTYNTAKHWRSDWDIPVNKPVPPETRMTINKDEILGLRPSVALDFAFFDIETSNLDANFSILMTACVKPYGQPPVVFRADNYPEWKTNRADDTNITRDIAAELRKHAIIVTHYGDRFDIPYIRAKMTKHNIEPLPLMFGIDTWKIARNNFKVTNRRLQTLVEFFDLGEKSGVEGGLWMKAAYEGSTKALDEIVAHNITDVEILEKLACVSFPFLRSIPRL